MTVFGPWLGDDEMSAAIRRLRVQGRRAVVFLDPLYWG